jgi:hypothetical protein
MLQNLTTWDRRLWHKNSSSLLRGSTVLEMTSAASHTGSFFILSLRHPIGFLWTSNQPVVKNSTYIGQHNNTERRGQTFMPSADSNLRSQRPSDQDLSIRMRGLWDQHSIITYFIQCAYNFSICPVTL